jgi:hypothetical protein
VKSEGKTWSGEVFNFRQEDWGECGERGWADNDEWSPLIEPTLVVVDGGEGEDEVAEPVRQAK